jgi:deoxyadenosine/deoxycytidine kinase
MIVALSGSLASGKESMAMFLKEEFNFQIYNLVERYASESRPETSDDIAKLEAFYDRKKTLCS